MERFRKLCVIILSLSFIFSVAACDNFSKFKEKMLSEEIISFPVKQGNSWGFIDTTGKFVIQPQFDGAGRFSDGFAAVKIGDRWGFIDKTGEYAINPQFDVAFLFHDGLASEIGRAHV